MDSEDKKRTIRKLIFDEKGKRDSEGTLNKEKDLSNKFCERPFDFFESQHFFYQSLLFVLQKKNYYSI